VAPDTPPGQAAPDDVLHVTVTVMFELFNRPATARTRLVIVVVLGATAPWRAPSRAELLMPMDASNANPKSITANAMTMNTGRMMANSTSD
jgi:hypothetical protein